MKSNKDSVSHDTLTLFAITMKWVSTLALLLSLSNEFACGHSTRKNIIVDTDLYSDVDDAGALLVACTHPGANLLGVNLNYPSIYTGLAASSLLGYYNRSSVPIGLKRPVSNDTYFDDYTFENGEYASKVAYHWRHHASLPWGDIESTWEPVRLYRKLLSDQAHQSVTIMSIGFLDNLSALLSSTADDFSPLIGLELVMDKVQELVVMGGSYPSGREFNFFGYNSTAAAHVVNTWPGKATFVGNQVGLHVISGARLTIEGPANDPVRAAYLCGEKRSRSSWDPLTLLYGIEGLGGLFRLGSETGHNYVYPDGRNVWKWWNDGRSHSYVDLAVSNETAGAILDERFLPGAMGVAHTNHSSWQRG
ncbi:inosine-uridine preferring nucleoside hydrolase-domain-containing protein [Aspergillus taichungensis]|uniref:Inosine-uridine preferring nucleoside hydrolase-domain-containing protein n=1 Tax=Aspergillus taichungensis TaxID=482145 RepID=A0A2J5I6T8_9EURO|nr:inosine-uridine preferring nucleoside hydrolase-domain-containing protein [Aspergillus taichungensis]